MRGANRKRRVAERKFMPEVGRNPAVAQLGIDQALSGCAILYPSLCMAPTLQSKVQLRLKISN